MNRIDIIKGKYVVLITPPYFNTINCEAILDNWYDVQFSNFTLMQFDRLEDAQFEALKYPDIDWYKIVSSHVELKKTIEKNVQEVIHHGKIICDMKVTLCSPEELKKNIIQRVINTKNYLNATFGISDIVTVTITNSWTRNLEFIASLLFRTKKLKIFDKMNKPPSIYLFGKTDVGTTYSIVLIPTHIHNVIQWLGENNNPASDAIFAKALEQQAQIDIQPLVL